MREKEWGGGVTIPTRGQTLWYSRYICTLYLYFNSWEHFSMPKPSIVHCGENHTMRFNNIPISLDMILSPLLVPQIYYYLVLSVNALSDETWGNLEGYWSGSRGSQRDVVYHGWPIHCIKGYQHSRPRSQDVIYQTNCRESLVSDIPAGDGNVGNLFLRCVYRPRTVYEPKCGGEGGGCGASANEYSWSQRAQITFGDLTP